MAKTVYTLRKKKDTEEYHLFKCTSTGTDICSCNKKSICNKMELSEKDKIAGFACEEENKARIKAAQIGKTVCGTCISHLYNTNL